MSNESLSQSNEANVGAEMITTNIRLNGTTEEYEQSREAFFTLCDTKPGTYRSLLRGAFLLIERKPGKEMEDRLKDLVTKVTNRGNLPRIAKGV